MKKNTFFLLTAVLVTAGIVSTSVLAAPPGPPPTPNAPAATFSSVTANNPSGAGITSTTTSGMGGASGIIGEITGAGWGYGVMGLGTSNGSFGVRGNATGTNGTGVQANGTWRGLHATTGVTVAASEAVRAESTAPNGKGVYASSTNSYGVEARSTNGEALYAHSTNSNGVHGVANTDIGVYGQSLGGGGVGVRGVGPIAGEFSQDWLGNVNDVKLGGVTYALDVDGTSRLIGNGGSNIDLTVSGRMRSGDSANAGGMWLGGATDHFIGQYDSTSFGFWNNSAWRFIVDNAGRLSNPTGWLRAGDDFWVNGGQLWVDGTSTLVGNVTAQNGLTVSGPTGTNIGLEVAGRIRSANGTSGQGGMWVGGAGGGQFFGSQNNTYAGIYNNGYWGLTTNYWGNSQTSGVLSTGQGIISAAGLLATSNIYSMNGWVDAERFTGRCQWTGDLGMGNDGYGVSGCSGDVAEVYQTTEKTEPGDILMLDPSGELKMKLADSKSNGKLMGVVSTSAGLILKDSGPVVSNGENDEYITDTQTLLALTGKAPVKVNLENGPIKVGDYITVSSTAGVGMKANLVDQVIGIAMENYETKQEDGKIFVLTDNAGSVSMLKTEMDKKIASLEGRLAKLEEQLNSAN